jgi:alkyl sulfatase BDS1-like metallo-beta-lactamase superfamily hydrolase
VAIMNTGASLDTVIHSVEVPAHLRDKPYLRPVYDHPQFIVRNVWRRYGGWHDGEPDHLLPSPRRELATEWVRLAGGVDAVLARAVALAAEATPQALQLACHLIEDAVIASGGSAAVHQAREQIYRARAMGEESSMARNLLLHAAESSKLGLRDHAGRW